MFDGPDLRVVMEIVGNKAIERAQAMTDETLLAATVEELVDGIMSELDLDPPVLDWEGRHGTERGSGRAIELQVPFKGTPGLFENQPNFYTSAGTPDGRVEGSEVVVALGPPTGFDARADQWRTSVEEYLRHVHDDIAICKNQLRGQLQGWITRRRREAEQHEEALRGLSIPIRRRGDAPELTPSQRS